MKEVIVGVVPLAAAVASKQILGMLWYTVLFGKAWKRETGLSDTQIKAGMGKAMVVDLGSNVLMAWILGHAIAYAGAATPGEMAIVGFFNWLGFVFASQIGFIFFEKLSARLIAIKLSYQLVSILIMSAVFAALAN